MLWYSLKAPRRGTFNAYHKVCFLGEKRQIQSNLDNPNTDGSFTMANLNSFLSSYEVLAIAQENKYLLIFLFFHEIVYCVYSLESPHRGDSNEYIQHTIIV